MKTNGLLEKDGCLKSYLVCLEFLSKGSNEGGAGGVLLKGSWWKEGETGALWGGGGYRADVQLVAFNSLHLRGL